MLPRQGSQGEDQRREGEDSMTDLPHVAVEHVTDLEGDLVNDSELAACWLCERGDRWVYRGLGTH